MEDGGNAILRFAMEIKNEHFFFPWREIFKGGFEGEGRNGSADHIILIGDDIHQADFLIPGELFIQIKKGSGRCAALCALDAEKMEQFIPDALGCIRGEEAGFRLIAAHRFEKADAANLHIILKIIVGGIEILSDAERNEPVIIFQQFFLQIGQATHWQKPLSKTVA